MRKGLRNRLTRFASGRSGTVAVEAALGLTLLFAVAAVFADMHTAGRERTRLETGAGEMAQTVASQAELTKYGLDALTLAAFQNNTRGTEIIVMNVMQSGKILWMLRRGDGAQLCQLDVSGDQFTGTLPVDPPDGNGESEDDTSEMSMVVIDACKRLSGFKSESGIAFPRLLQVRNIYRAGQVEINLDKELTDENLISSDDDDEESES